MNHTKIVEELISCKLSSDLHTCSSHMTFTPMRACTHTYTHTLENIERKYLSKEKKKQKLRTVDVLIHAAY